MNGVLKKISEARQRQWDEATRGQTLSVDLLLPEEQLFTESLDRLRDLEMAMLKVFTNEGWALKALGAANEMAFHAQRKLLAELIAFEQTHKDFNPLVDGKRLHDWIKANGGVFNREKMHTGWIVIRPLVTEIIEPPAITQQPAERVLVVEGEPAIFSVGATGTNLSYQWYRDDKLLLDATKSIYTMYNTDWFFDRAKFHVVIRNSAGEVHSNDAVLRVVKA